jgi:hypothetical protein
VSSGLEAGCASDILVWLGCRQIGTYHRCIGCGRTTPTRSEMNGLPRRITNGGNSYCCMPRWPVLEKTLDKPARLADGLGIKVNPVRSWIRPVHPATGSCWAPDHWFPRFAALSNRRCEFGLPNDAALDTRLVVCRTDFENIVDATWRQGERRGLGTRILILS